MHFKIITVGWDCANEIEQTLQSVEEQTYKDWKIHIVSDPSPEPQFSTIRNWCNKRDDRWQYTLNVHRQYAVRNQIEGIRAMDPEPEDVVVFLDLDGDRLAHRDVLKHLVEYYADGTEATYGSYTPIPDPGTTSPAGPFPDAVIRDGTYRAWIRKHGSTFNHLRTVKYKLLAQIPDSYFQWPDGTWLNAGTDYAVMTAALELAEKHKFIEEVLLLYNHNQPHPDYLYHPSETSRCAKYILDRQPLVGVR